MPTIRSTFIGFPGTGWTREEVLARRAAEKMHEEIMNSNISYIFADKPVIANHKWRRNLRHTGLHKKTIKIMKKR